jgi:hypothetical protein
MKSTYSVLTIFKSISENKSSRSEINQLIELSQSYAYSYLKYRYKNLSKILMSEDVTLQELAIDTIAPLFERSDEGLFLKIAKAFNEWTPKIETEDQALFFLNGLVAKSTEKYVSELLRQSDPFFSKILDSVNYLIVKNNYLKKQLVGTTYIVEKENLIKIGMLPDSKFINELPIELFTDNKNAVSKIFEFIKSSSDKTPAIPLNALVMKIKQVKASNFVFMHSTSNGNESEIDSIVNKALDVTYSKMQETYVNKGKLEKYEAAGIKKAIESIMYDMRDGGINPGLHKYFLEQFSKLTFEDYERRYQNIFEYLFKVLKKEIAEQLK